MIRRVLTFSIVFGFFLIHQGSADSIPSNRQLAVRLMVEPALQHIYHYSSLSSAPQALLFPPNESDSELSRWFRQSLIDSCVARDYTVFVNSSNARDSLISVEIAQPDITFEYRSAGRRWVFFNKGYLRQVKSDFHLSIKTEQGRVLLSRRFNDEFQDGIKDINAIEDKDLTFTKGRKTGSAIAKRLLEPALITAATVTMVYLFYSLRSGK